LKGLAAGWAWRGTSAPTRRWRQWAGALAALAGLLLAVAPPLAFPVPRLPDPGGPHRLGTVSFHWVDAGRLEAYTPDPADQREIMVQLWYPAELAAGAEPAPWMERLDVAGPAIARYLKLPDFILDHTALIRTHAYPDAPLSTAEPRYPVILYSHGWNGFRTTNLDEVEALASRGYVVVTIDHTYGAMLAVFSDGRVVPNRPDALPSDDLPEAEAQPIREQLVGTYAGDLVFALDQLERLNAGELTGRFAGRLDLERVGLFGHSTGGGAVVLACGQDPRCRAGVGLDAWLVPVPEAAIEAGLSQPVLFMWSEVWSSARNDARFAQLVPRLRGDFRSVTIQGTRHYDFTLLPLLSPLAPALGLKGPLEGARVMRIVDDYLAAFFDQALKGRPSPLWDGPAAGYPEVVYELP
jgi:predicted dienelactone hydrolase